ncbi:MAG: undecaprenyldiphospho-muramoylpentapeptide beta-N-acetylglucosaminyltransferase [Candidatus Omnitrophica bacterium]|nr:undecaprenyldiphospho-muramoylpentapeptide beta-N-acetylglucosaminyltransferase [Candidatus Omnitrophota bacterium]
MVKKILVTAGSSGGHIFPAVSLVEGLRERDSQISVLLVLPKRSRNVCTVSSGIAVKYISTSVIKLRFSYQNFKAIVDFIKGSFESLLILLKYRPDVVVGFGSIDSLPLVLFAWFFRKKTVLHEQNVVPGRANRLLAKFVDKVAISFDKTREYLDVNQQKIILSGNPLRSSLKKIDRVVALKFLGLDQDKLTILVMGGSQGSHRINECFLEAVSPLAGRFDIQVMHISGANDADFLNSAYKKLNLRAKVVAFLDDMQYAYSVANLSVCRSGATTVSELVFFKLPAVLVPFPFAYGHQQENAKGLEERGAGIIIEESALDADSLRKVLVDLINNPDKAQKMGRAYEKVSCGDACNLLVDEVLKV